MPDIFAYIWLAAREASQELVVMESSNCANCGLCQYAFIGTVCSAIQWRIWGGEGTRGQAPLFFWPFKAPVHL